MRYCVQLSCFFSLLSSGTVLESSFALHDIYILESIGQSFCRHSLSLELSAIWAEMSPEWCWLLPSAAHLEARAGFRYWQCWLWSWGEEEPAWFVHSNISITLRNSQISCVEILWASVNSRLLLKISPTRWSIHWWLWLESIIMVVAKWWYSYSIIPPALINTSNQRKQANREGEEKAYYFGA